MIRDSICFFQWVSTEMKLYHFQWEIRWTSRNISNPNPLNYQPFYVLISDQISFTAKYLIDSH